MKPKRLGKLFHLLANEDPQQERMVVATDASQEEFECCIMCGKRTNVPVTMPIDQRKDYEVGCGQLCTLCKQKLRNTN